MCLRKKVSCLFDLFKAFVSTERAIINIFLSSERPTFLPTCATCSELPSNVSTMVVPDKLLCVYGYHLTNASREIYASIINKLLSNIKDNRDSDHQSAIKKLM